MSEDNRIKYHWSYFCIVLSAVPFVLFGIVICIMLIRAPLWGSLAVLAGMAVIMGYMLFQCPLYLVDNKEEIIIKLFRRTIKIPKDQIREMRRIDKNELGNFYREWEAGLGYTGLYRSRKLGPFYIYATELSNLYLIVTGDRKYVVSCTKRLEL